MAWLSRTRLRILLPVLAAMLISGRAQAQEDPNETPLGDIARNLRKKTPPTQPVIDDDNLPEAMRKAERRQGFASSLRFLMAGAGNGLRVSAPDVTCSLAFTADMKSLLSKQYAQMELPAADVARLEGHATAEGDALTVTVVNATDWHVSELAVALTVVRKTGKSSVSGDALTGPNGDAAGASGFTDTKLPDDLLPEARPEKKPDVTVIYRMRAAAPPGGRTVFSAPLELDVAPTDEWHWAIVQAKGYPPQGYPGASAQTAARAPASLLPTSLSTIPQTAPALAISPAPQP